MNSEPIEEKLAQAFFDALYADLSPVRTESADAPDDTDSSRLRRLVEHWPGALFCLDTQLNCRLVNQEARSWIRDALPDEDLSAHGLPDCLDPALMEALQPYLSAALLGMDTGFEDRFEHPARGLRQVSIRVQPDTVGECIQGIFLHLDDQTDKHHAALLAQAHQVGSRERADMDAHLRLLAEGLRDAAIFFLDADGCVSDWTPSAQRLTGYTAEQMRDKDLTHFVPAGSPASDLTDPMTLGVERAALLGQSETPGWQRRADGSLFWAHTSLTALFDHPSGEAIGYACLMRDMTENKRLVDTLQELNAALETRIEERTRELQDMNHDLEAFSSSVSHDLRAPLRHIGSFVELLREDLGPDAPADALRHLDTVAESARHMGDLIEGLLAFSKLGRAPLQRRPVAMADLLHSSLNRVRHDPALQRPEGEVCWALPPELPTIAGDPTLLSQVWDNLLANALKYSRHRMPAHIRIACRPTPPSAQAPHDWVFEVHDNGVGFNPKRADRLFGMFQRLHRANEFEGTGIGLALCRRIVERHGGRIWAQSEPGMGSTFSFSLPAL